MHASVVMAMAWTKSGLDFLGPTLWAVETFQNEMVICIVISALMWLCGCSLMILTIATGSATERYSSLLWLGAGGFYAYTLGDPRASLESFSALVAAISWIGASLLWALAMWWTSVMGTRRIEAMTIIGFFVCGLAFLGTAAGPLDAGVRWTCVSSGMWWLVGIGAWSFNLFARGESYFELAQKALAA